MILSAELFEYRREEQRSDNTFYEREADEVED
jgi:hypothetical protein